MQVILYFHFTGLPILVGKSIEMKNLFALAVFVFMSGCAGFVQDSVSYYQLNLPQGGQYTFVALSPDIISVRYTNDSIASDRIHAPIDQDTTRMKVSEEDQVVSLSTNAIRISIDLSNYRVSYYDIRTEQLKVSDLGGLVFPGIPHFIVLGWIMRSLSMVQASGHCQWIEEVKRYYYTASLNMLMVGGTKT